MEQIDPAGQEYVLLQKPISPEFRYASFIVRIWRRVNGAAKGDDCCWLGEIEHLQSGQRWRFDTLDEVPELLQRQAEELRPG
jgi:hypothetical protein